MPWYYPKRRRRYRRRWRTWRFGRPIRRYPRRRRRVRKFPLQKLKKIFLEQWQPPSIRKCHIKGLNCLVYVNQKRLSWNSTIYDNSIVPEHEPGGGGFAVMKFTLSNLWDLHQKCQNWWTASNENLPLCRYMGLRLRCYRADTVDYVLAWQNSGPFVSNKLTYTSCQPAMFLMRKNKIIVTSKKTNNRKKPYKTIRIRPPSLLENKWYFQQEFCNQTLVILHAAPISLDHYYISTSSENNNISITHLNTQFITNQNFGGDKYKNEHWPVRGTGTTTMYLYRYDGNSPLNNPDNFLIADICPITYIRQPKEGASYNEAKVVDHNLQESAYKQHLHEKYAGSIFNKHNLAQEHPMFYSTINPTTMFNNFNNNSANTLKLSSIEPHSRAFTPVQDEFVTYTRYNPNRDTGQTTKMWLTPNNKDLQNWEPPEDPKLSLEGFPLWLNIFGFIDFQKQLKELIAVDNQYILCFRTSETIPKYPHTFVVIDNQFRENKSPYLDYLKESDYNSFYPKVLNQVNSINDITESGPGTAKLEQRHSEEIKIEYDFYFKWGGDPAKMVTVDNPCNQAIYPVPRNVNEKPSLQGPAQGYETVVWSFDQRNYQLTKAALERMQKDWETQRDLFSITEPDRTVPMLETLQKVYEKAQTEEEKQETLLKQLQYNKQQQLLLKQRILEMIQRLEKSE